MTQPSEPAGTPGNQKFEIVQRARLRFFFLRFKKNKIKKLARIVIIIQVDLLRYIRESSGKSDRPVCLCYRYCLCLLNPDI